MEKLLGLGERVPNYIEYRALELCNGHRSMDEITRLLAVERSLDLAVLSKDIFAILNEWASLDCITWGDGLPCISSTQVLGRLRRRYSVWGPSRVFWDITTLCNSRCPHCYANAGHMLGGELTTEEIFQVIEQFGPMPPYLIEYGGGEPLLREDALAIFRRTKERLSIRIKLLTNGSLVTAEVARELARYIDFAQISVDGIGKTHDRFRQKQGAFDDAITALKLLRAAGVPTGTATTLFPGNLDQLEQIIQLALELGVSKVRFFPVVPIGRGVEIVNQHGISRERLREVYDYLIARRDELEGKLLFETRDGFYGHALSHVSGAWELHREQGQFLLCTAGIRVFQITPQGYVTPCVFLNLPEYRVGNVKESSVTELWKHAEVFNQLRTLTVDQIEQCRDCQRRDLCGGGLRCDAVGRFASIYAPDPNCCYYTPAR